MTAIKKIISICLLLTICILIFSQIKNGINLEKLEILIRSYGLLAPLFFVLVYSIAPIFFMPITPLSITAGVLFGPVLGTVLTVIGSTLGASASFLVSRYLMKDWFDKKSSAKIDIIKDKVSKEGWKFVAVSRITPIFPFNFQNYIFGITDIPLKVFFITSIVSLIPGSFAYVYLGYAGKSAFTGGHNFIAKIGFAVLFLCIVALLPYLIGKMRRRV